MRLKNVGRRFRSKLKIVGGQKILGQILDIPDTSRVSNFLSARRYLRVGPRSPVKASDVIQTPSGKYIASEHGDGYFIDHIYTHFKLFKVDMTTTVKRSTVSEDPITGIEKRNPAADVGTAYISIQPKSDTSDSINIQVPQHVIISNVELRVDDTLNEGAWVVTEVDNVLGIWLAEVKDV